MFAAAEHPALVAGDGIAGLSRGTPTFDHRRCGGVATAIVRGWIVTLQGLANDLGLRILVCHFPPGTSKWQRVEMDSPGGGRGKPSNDWRGALAQHRDQSSKFGRRCLHELFQERVQNAPDRIAVSARDVELSYGELDARANRVANRLKVLGVGPDGLVGLCVDRTPEMIIGMLGILKAGGAYVPMDPRYPDKRIRLLLAESAVSVVVTEARVATVLENCGATRVFIDEGVDEIEEQPVSPPIVTCHDRNLAYAIFTSGSTGVPKGVLIEHRNVVRLFEQTDHWFGFNEHDVWTMFHSLGFDFSVWEIWGALLYGGRLVIVPYETARSPGDFDTLIRDAGITVLNQTPSAFRRLIAAERSKDGPAALPLRVIILGGENLGLNMLRPWLAHYGDQEPVLVNMYGITEATVHATYKRITKEDLEHSHLSPVGVPIPDMEIHLLDAAGQPVPDGIPGEMYIAGPGLARGYLNRPELTAERFVASGQDQPGLGRLYRSGDRALRGSDGELYYLGRSDEQIKVSGYRIEPQEIELCLTRHPRVTAAAVSAHKYADGDVRIVAYVQGDHTCQATPEGAEALRHELVQHTASELPAWMKPSTFVMLPELPMTEHGKVDRRTLCPPHPTEQVAHAEAADGRSPTEQAVREIWEEILEQKGIGATDDFFDIGGTSLALIRVFERLVDRFGIELDLAVVIQGATIEHLARCVDEHVASGNTGGRI